MNRIILVGNGFDLAHNLPTSYKNFNDWYWERVMRELMWYRKHPTKYILTN